MTFYCANGLEYFVTSKAVFINGEVFFSGEIILKKITLDSPAEILVKYQDKFVSFYTDSVSAA